MYCLNAVIAGGTVLSKLAASFVQAAHIVPLEQHLSLLPVPDVQFDVTTAAEDSEIAGFWTVPPDFASILAACSEAGPLAYVEAEFFGGTGTQSAQVWDRGTVVLGPLHVPEGEPHPAEGSPISQALRKLGVAKGGHFDEFDAVRLGRCRSTEDWFRYAS